MPQNYVVIVQAEAFRDLDEILDHVGRQSSQGAAQLIDRLWNAMQSLSEFPRRYKVYRTRKDPRYAIHSMPVRPYVVYYRVSDSPACVRILTVRHAARRRPRDI